MPGAGPFNVLPDNADNSYSSENRDFPAVVVRDYFNSM
jgi:hypothetical protein